MHVGDPLGEAVDDLEVVAAAVGDVPGVQAQVHELRVRVLEEFLDSVLGVDVGVRVRVEHQLDAEFLEDHPTQLVGPGDQVRPLLRIHIGRLEEFAGVHVRVLLGQLDQVLRADLGEQLGFPAEIGDSRVQRHSSLVQPGEHGAAADLQATLIELVTELLRVLREETLRAELGPDVAGVGDVVQVLLPADLMLVLREPHTPGIGRGAQPESGQVGGCHGLDLLGSGGDGADPATGCCRSPGAVAYSDPAIGPRQLFVRT